MVVYEIHGAIDLILSDLEGRGQQRSKVKIVFANNYVQNNVVEFATKK